MPEEAAQAGSIPISPLHHQSDEAISPSPTEALWWGISWGTFTFSADTHPKNNFFFFLNKQNKTTQHKAEQVGVH